MAKLERTLSLDWEPVVMLPIPTESRAFWRQWALLTAPFRGPLSPAELDLKQRMGKDVDAQLQRKPRRPINLRSRRGSARV